MRLYSTSDTLIRPDHKQMEPSPFASTPDDEMSTVKRPGGKLILNYQKVARAFTKTVSSFDLGRQIYG